MSICGFFIAIIVLSASDPHPLTVRALAKLMLATSRSITWEWGLQQDDRALMHFEMAPSKGSWGGAGDGGGTRLGRGTLIWKVS